MSYDTCNLSSVSQNVLKFYQQLTGEKRRIPFIFDDFHFCHFNIKFNNSGTAKVKIVKDKRNPPLFIGKWLIKCQNILRNNTQVIRIVSQNVLKLYQQHTGEERRVPVIFDDFHFCRSSVISRPITLEPQKGKSSKMKGNLLSSPVSG
jgi:hypothetical protein